MIEGGKSVKLGTGMSKHEKLRRNEPCHCGSGKKYKTCCLGKTEREEKQAPVGLSIGIALIGLVGAGMLFFYKGVGAGLAGGAAAIIIALLVYVLRDPNPPRGGKGDSSAINFGK